MKNNTPVFRSDCFHHTPKLTASLLRELSTAFPKLKFVDTSWHNDAIDSVEIENKKVQLPDGAGRGLRVNRYRIWVPDRSQGKDYSDYVLAEVTTNCSDEDKETRFKNIEELKKALAKI